MNEQQMLLNVLNYDGSDARQTHINIMYKCMHTGIILELCDETICKVSASKSVSEPKYMCQKEQREETVIDVMVVVVVVNSYSRL